MPAAARRRRTADARPGRPGRMPRSGRRGASPRKTSNCCSIRRKRRSRRSISRPATRRRGSRRSNSEFSGSPPSPDAATVQLISDVQLDLDMELGRTHMYLEDV